MECQFSSSTDLGEGDFEYSILTCPEDPHFELIQNASTGAQFFVQKSMNYGEALIVFFLALFSIVFICGIIWRFFWKNK